MDGPRRSARLSAHSCSREQPPGELFVHSHGIVVCSPPTPTQTINVDGPSHSSASSSTLHVQLTSTHTQSYLLLAISLPDSQPSSFLNNLTPIQTRSTTSFINETTSDVHHHHCVTQNGPPVLSHTTSLPLPKWISPTRSILHSPVTIQSKKLPIH